MASVLRREFLFTRDRIRPGEGSLAPRYERHLLARVKDPPGAYALLMEGAQRAVVFVHGFFGNAHSSWRDFQGLVDRFQDDSGWWRNSDLYFYSYRSWQQVMPQARHLRKFLVDHVLANKAEDCPILYSYVLPSGFVIETTLQFKRNYKELVLVGHSTGGVLIRAAILEEIDAIESRAAGSEASTAALDTTKSPVLNASVRLFAPAHKGAICAGRLAFVRNLPISERLAGLLLESSPLFQNIQPASPVLGGIERRTGEFVQKYKSMRGLRADSLFGDSDAIVNIDKYVDDPRLITLGGHGHTSICKPNVEYTLPLEFVTDAQRTRSAHC